MWVKPYFPSDKKSLIMRPKRAGEHPHSRELSSREIIQEIATNDLANFYTERRGSLNSFDKCPNRYPY